MAQYRNSGDQGRGEGGPVRDIAIGEVGKWLVKIVVILLLVVFGASLIGFISKEMMWVVEKTVGQYFQFVRDLLTYGPFSHRGLQSFIPFLAITGVVAVLVKYFLRK